MKKKVCTTALIAFLLLLLITAETTIAGNPDYSIIAYQVETLATIDGEWTTDNEWTNAPITEMSDNANFRYNVVVDEWIMQWIVEIFDDATDDAEDYWQICIDDSNGGGTAPQPGDFRVDIVGHTDLVFYEGNGQGWDEITPQDGEIEWANSIVDSPINTTPHWILELAIIKTIRVAVNPTPTGMRVAYYDASNPEAGVQAWAPDSDPDIPDEWGLISTHTSDPYEPTGLEQVATPTFFPGEGRYASATSVTISCDTEGATIRYTLDGTTPTSSSTVYTDPISVTSGSVTIKARAFKSGMADSNVTTRTYTILVRDYIRVGYYSAVKPTVDGFWTSTDEWTDGEPTMIGEDIAFRSTWSLYSGNDSLIWTTEFVIEILNDNTDDAGDYWQICIDGLLEGGSAPQPGDFKFEITGHTDLVWYEGTGTGWTEVELDESEIEWANSLSASPTNTAPHWILEFQISKFTGTVLTGACWGMKVAVYDESNPGAGVQTWPPNSDADIPEGWGIENYAFGVYKPTEQVATPTFSPVAGTYSSAQSVSISCTTSDATIYYTLDGSTPTSSSTVYTDPISVASGSVTIKARAFRSNWFDSDIASATYTIQPPEQVATPTFSPTAGTYESAQSVTISCSTSGATIRYTTNGADPTSSSPIYTNPISVSGGSVTIKARAFKSGWTDSNIAIGTYTIEYAEQVATPTFSPVAGTYTSAQSVTISCSTSGATIRYTLDGSTPTSSSTVYTNPISMTSGSVTIKARAFRSDWTDSEVATGTYTIQSTEQVATPTFSPTAGTYESAQSVTIYCSTNDATIRYTTDGADPTSSSPIYTNPISVSGGSVTIKARAFKSGMTDSEVATGTYTIQSTEQVATPTFSPTAGTYESAQSVTISCSTSGATIRYTLDGSTPTSSSTVYSSAISVGSGSVTIKAKAFKSDWTDSSVATGTYTIESNPIALSIEWIAAIISLCGLTAGAGGWIFRSYSARKRHKILFTKLMEDIDDIYTRFKMNTLRCETELYRYKNQVLEDFKQGLIDEEKYNVLDTRIDKYLKEIEEEKAKER